MTSKNRINNIQKLLNELGFKIDSLGYQYWIYAINKSCKEYWKYSYTMEIVYNDVAKFYKTTRDRVERCMRHASINAKAFIRNKYNYKGSITTKVILQLLVREVF